MHQLNLSTMNINELDSYSLLIVFELLNIKDISVCSLVDKRWYSITKHLINIKKKSLVVYFGLESNPTGVQVISSFKRTKFSRSVDQLKSTEPLLVDDNQLLSALNVNKLEPIEQLSLITNNHYRLDQTFDFKLLPNLKHLETNDTNLCQLILNESKINELRLPTVDRLSLRFSTLDALSKSFPNLNYLELDHLNLEFNSREINEPAFTNLTYLIIKKDKLTTGLIDFLVANCKRLEYLQIKLDDGLRLVHLDRLITELGWCKELNLFCEIYDTFELKQLLRKHSTRFAKRDYKLSINQIRVEPELKNLEPIYSLGANGYLNMFELKQMQQDGRSNFRRDAYYDRIRSITVIDNKQIDKFVNFYPKLKNLEELIVYENPKQQFTLTLDRLRMLPRSIKQISFKFAYEMPQSILDTLPELFPHLIKLTLAHLGRKEYDLTFLSKLKYLNELNLIDLSLVDCGQLGDAIVNCKFLSNLDIQYLEKKETLESTEFLGRFERKRKETSSLGFDVHFRSGLLYV